MWLEMIGWKLWAGFLKRKVEFGKAKGRMMEIIKRSEEFCHFLSTLKHNCVEEVFLEEYKASFLEAGTTTPFSNFIGKHSRPTVVISKYVPKESSDVAESNLNNNSVSLEGMELLADLSTSGTGVDILRVPGDPLPISSLNAVPVGQPLGSNRTYLTHSSPFYKGWSGAQAKTNSFAQDGGLVPLSLDSARFIASLYSLGFRKAQGALPDMWVLCERNQQGVVALGCTFDGPKCPLFVFTVKEGDFTSETDSTRTGVKLSGGTVFSEYDILNSSFEEAEQSGEFKIQFSWSDPDGILSAPTESSDAVLKVSSIPGDQFSPVLSIHEELKSLYRLCEILNSGADWPTCDDDDGDDDSEEVLTSSSCNKTVEEVDIFIEDMANPLIQPADITVISPTADHMIYEPRTDLDFTERLWLLCREVQSFDELQQVFARVFKAVLLGKIQPFVHRKSTSMLAVLLRQLLLTPDRDGLQDIAPKFQLLLTETKLLPCLVQLGMEKMSRDYQYFFVGGGTCLAEQFERFLSPAPSSLLAQCLGLCKLHSALELNVCVMRLLRLPDTSIMSTFTKAAVEVFKADTGYQPFAPTPVFSLPLPAYSPALKSVVAMCSKLTPVTWCVTTARPPQNQRRLRQVCLVRNKPLLCYLRYPVDNPPTTKSELYLYECHYDASF